MLAAAHCPGAAQQCPICPWTKRCNSHTARRPWEDGVHAVLDASRPLACTLFFKERVLVKTWHWLIPLHQDETDMTLQNWMLCPSVSWSRVHNHWEETHVDVDDLIVQPLVIAEACHVAARHLDIGRPVVHQEILRVAISQRFCHLRHQRIGELTSTWNSHMFHTGGS